MKCQYIVVSESFAMDQASGRVSIFHVLDKMILNSSPFLLSEIVIVGLFDREAGDGDQVSCNISICVGPKVIFKEDQNINFGKSSVNRFFQQMQGVITSDIGDLRFSVKIKDTEVGYWTVPIIYTGKPETKPATKVSGKLQRAKI